MLKGIIRRYIRKQKWRKRNTHNETVCLNYFNFDHVEVGNYTYGGLTVLDFGNDSRLKIGSFCSIASGVVFALSGDHNVKRFSTFPFRNRIVDRSFQEGVSKGNIIVDDDVWLGQNAIVLSGVHIGQGAVIAAGAVVTKNVPPYAIVGGVPATVMNYRFEENIIKELLDIDYSRISRDFVINNIDLIEQNVTDTIDFSFLPKRGT